MSDKFLTRAFRRYSRIAPGAIYESQVQVLVERNLPALFPDYFGKIMEPYFRTAAGDVQPDIVLIRRDFCGWMLVEVEIEGHSAQAHILPQLSKLVRVNFNDSLVKMLIEEYSDEHDISKLMKAISFKPEVTLIIHGESSKFQDELQELGVYSLDIGIHSFPPDDYVLEVLDREQNYLDTGQVCKRSLNAATQYVWSLPKIDHFPLKINENLIEVKVGTEISLWGVKENRSDYLLRQPSGIQSLEGVNEVQVQRHRNFGSLRFIPVVERI